MPNWENVKMEAQDLLQALIRINTSNPPGNEKAATDYLKEVANQYGFHTKEILTAENRANLLISYQGTFKNPYIFLSHVDVVPAHAEDWDHDPFAGVVENDVLYGRGTIDTKQLTVMQFMAMRLLKNEGVKLARDLVMVVTADEENGSQFGLVEVLKEYGELFQEAYVINEGGGFPIVVNEIPHYLCEVGQKGLCRLKFKFRKNPNANPYFPDNQGISESAVLISELNKLTAKEPIPATTKKLLQELLLSAGYSQSECQLSLEEQLHLLAPYLSPFLSTLLKAMARTTFTVTRWKAGRRSGLTDSVAEIEVDGRVLPGVTKEKATTWIQTLIKGRSIDFEITDFSEGYESEFASPLFEEISAEIKREIPNSKTVPFLSTGSNDGRFLRRYHSKVYGLSPMLPDMTFEKVLPLVHGVNEHIPLSSLVFGTRVLYQVMKNSLTEG